MGNADDVPDGRTVKLTYFKPDTGKLYTVAEFQSKEPIWTIWDNVRKMVAERRCPDLMAGHTQFVTLIEVEGFEMKLVIP